MNLPNFHCILLYKLCIFEQTKWIYNAKICKGSIFKYCYASKQTKYLYIDILQKNSLTPYKERVGFGELSENRNWNAYIPFDPINSCLDKIIFILVGKQNQSNMKKLEALVNFLYNE